MSQVEKSEDIVYPSRKERDEFHYLSSALTYTMTTSIFGKCTVVTGTFSIDGPEERLEFVKRLLPEQRFSIGGELENDIIYMHRTIPGITVLIFIGTMELKTADVIEQSWWEFASDRKGGLLSLVAARGTGKNGKAFDYVLENTMDSGGYISGGLSYNPFK